MSAFESVVEEAAIEWLGDLGCTHVPGPVLASAGEAPEGTSYREVVLEGRLRNTQLTPASSPRCWSAR